MSNKDIDIQPKNELKNEFRLLAQYPQLNVPQVSRRALLAMGSLMALNLAACGSSDDTAAGSSSSGGGGSVGAGNMVTTFAGSSSFNSPRGVAVDSSGNVYVADYYNNMIRKITSAGVVTTLAGGGSGTATNGTGTAASFSGPFGVAVDSSGNVYVADSGNNMIRKIVVSTQAVALLAGNLGVMGLGGYADGTGAAASFKSPNGVAVDSSGNVYVADSNNHMIRQITSAGVVTTLAGSTTHGSANGTGTAASFNYPSGVAVDSSGNVYVADTNNNLIRKIVVSTQAVTTLAGGGSGVATNGTGTAASFNLPYGVAVDSSGNVYVADTFNSNIRMITSAGVVTTLAGLGIAGSNDGAGTAAGFYNPQGVAVDSSGNVYVADTGNNEIRKIS